jgi:hypothetical protein
MVTLLITALVIVGLLAIAIYFWQKPETTSHEHSLSAAPGRALFAPEIQLEQNTKLLDQPKRDEILKRAHNGNIPSLKAAAELNDQSFYEQVMAALADTADTHQLVSFAMRNELTISVPLAQKFIDVWRAQPEAIGTAKMLHIAARSDDATTFRVAVEEALEYWRKEKLTDVSAIELKAIINGEYWVLSQKSRASGAGFRLKQVLAESRKELETSHN